MSERTPLSLRGLKKLSRSIRSREVRALVGGLLELCWISQRPNGLNSLSTWESS